MAGYCIRENVPYNDYDFATKVSGTKFDCSALLTGPYGKTLTFTLSATTP